MFFRCKNGNSSREVSCFRRKIDKSGQQIEDYLFKIHENLEKANGKRMRNYIFRRWAFIKGFIRRNREGERVEDL